MSPEYVMGGKFSEKSDVFSFGVIVLEMISGRRNTSFYNEELSLGLHGYVSLGLNDHKNVFICTRLDLSLLVLDQGVEGLE